MTYTSTEEVSTTSTIAAGGGTADFLTVRHLRAGGAARGCGNHGRGRLGK